MNYDRSGSNTLISFLDQPIESAVSLSRTQLKKIAKALGPRVFDILVANMPDKYQERTLAASMKDLIPGEMATLKGRVKRWKRGFGRAPSVLFLEFGNGALEITFFGKVGGIYASMFQTGQDVLVSGEINPKKIIPTLVNPDIFKYDESWRELISGNVPVYKKIQGVSHLFMLRSISEILKKMRDVKGEWMPSDIYEKFELPGFIEAISNVHFPLLGTDIDELNDMKSPWHRRVAFDKLFFFKYGAQRDRIGGDIDKKRKIITPSKLSQNCEKNMAFELTRAQKRVLEEIRKDIGQTSPMNRLMQGDVGSGKTAVMMLAGLDVIESGYKVVIMAPTEILARQHVVTIEKTVPQTIKTELFVGGVTGKKKKAERLERAKEADFIVGTHALFENLEIMEDIGLVIIDEQHRFGVSQRLKLSEKAKDPDVLVVSATPIPRSLAHTIYGATDISAIDEMPPGRTPVKTKFVPFVKRDNVFDYINEIVVDRSKKGYWVCPLVEESEKIDLQNVVDVFEEFKKILGDKVMLLHGKMKGDEKDRIINSLKTGEANLLVSTIVVEVGVDITDATFMVIENAERFGLAQLHQLRGRVGRGLEKSFCALISSKDVSSRAVKRLEYLSANTNGFKVAEYDLKTRGPGALTGLEQSGFRNDPYFILAARYGELVEKAGQCVIDVFKDKDSDFCGSVDKIFEKFFVESYNLYRTG